MQRSISALLAMPTVVNGLRSQFRVVVAVAKDLSADEALLLEFRKLMNELENDGHGWSRLIPVDRGIPVLWEEDEHQPETEFRYREELTGMETRALPTDTFMPPEGYRKVKFDSACARFR